MTEIGQPPSAYDMLLDELARVDGRCETYLRAFEEVKRENETLRRQLGVALRQLETVERVLQNGMMG